MNQQELRQFYDIITASVDGRATAEQFQVLKKTLREDPDALRYYADYMSIYCHFRFSTEIPVNVEENDELNESSFDMELWSELAQYEAQAATLQQLKDSDKVPEKELIQKVEYHKTPKKINKFSLISAVTGIAAILLLVLILQYIPVPVQVAVLEDSIDAKWHNDAFSTEKNSVFSSGRGPMVLEKGIVKFLLNNDVRAIVEAPARFEIVSANEVKLYEGRLFGSVPKKAIGFTVSSKHSKVVDLGTDFGVNVNQNEDLLVHVKKGKVRLSAAVEDTTADSQVIPEKHAMKASADGMSLSPIDYNDRGFVQDISSKEGTIWRGENLDLVDITAGGKGYGPKHPFCAINPASGQITQNRNVEMEFYLSSQYSVVDKNAAIDGVFIPDGSQGNVVISSQGDVFADCPETCGQWFVPIMTQTVPIIYVYDKNQLRDMTVQPPVLNNYTYGIQDHRPALTLHANIGITYDLNVIRTFAPGKIVKFTAECGLSEAVNEKDIKADVWFLVDGRLKAHYNIIENDRRSQSITFEINDSDRFLTLTTTDGGNWNRSDWLVVAEPELMMQ